MLVKWVPLFFLVRSWLLSAWPKQSFGPAGKIYPAALLPNLDRDPLWVFNFFDSLLQVGSSWSLASSDPCCFLVGLLTIDLPPDFWSQFPTTCSLLWSQNKGNLGATRRLYVKGRRPMDPWNRPKEHPWNAGTTGAPGNFSPAVPVKHTLNNGLIRIDRTKTFQDNILHNLVGRRIDSPCAFRSEVCFKLGSKFWNSREMIC